MAPGVYFMLLTLCIQFGTSFQTTDEQSACGRRWRKFQDMCYRYIRKDVTWYEAKFRCVTRGGVLAEPDTIEKQQFLRHMISGRSSVWLGGTDRKAEGTWVWSSSGTPVDATLWFPSQPDAYYGDEDCLGMGYDGWFDLWCTWKREYVCQKPANVPNRLL